MWKCFLKTNNGLAIKSTVKKLIKSLECSEEEVHMGQVYYRDFKNTTFFELMREDQNQMFNGLGGVVNPFFYKRVDFEHEKELRLYYIDMPIPHLIRDGVEREPFEYKRINVNVSDLVGELVVSPFADDWFKSLIEDILRKVGLDIPVTKSGLYVID